MLAINRENFLYVVRCCHTFFLAYLAGIWRDGMCVNPSTCLSVSLYVHQYVHPSVNSYGCNIPGLHQSDC